MKLLKLALLALTLSAFLASCSKDKSELVTDHAEQNVFAMLNDAGVEQFNLLVESERKNTSKFYSHSMSCMILAAVYAYGPGCCETTSDWTTEQLAALAQGEFEQYYDWCMGNPKSKSSPQNPIAKIFYDALMDTRSLYDRDSNEEQYFAHFWESVIQGLEDNNFLK